MEVVEDPLNKTSVDSVDAPLVCNENKVTVSSVDTDICQKTNGDAKSGNAELTKTTPPEELNSQNIISAIESIVNDKNGHVAQLPDSKEASIHDDMIQTYVIAIEESPSDINTVPEIPNKESLSEKEEKNVVEETLTKKTVLPIDNYSDSKTEKVTFETEILVESNDNEIIENEIKIETNSNLSILSQIGQSIELSDVLCASDVIGSNMENNNCSVPTQEMFNKEELLDILEGNDRDHAKTSHVEENVKITSNDVKVREAQIALEQLSRLQSKTRRLKSMESRRKKGNRKTTKEDVLVEDLTLPEEVTVAQEVIVVEEGAVAVEAKEESIVKDLVKDWDDEDHLEEDSLNQTLDQTSVNDKSKDDVSIQQERVKQEDGGSSLNEHLISNKTLDEGVPQRRLGRVIKKKVIFDPDNPDTYTKSKAVKPKDNVGEKEHPPVKKIKVEQIHQGQQRSKSKSPITKLQWKKPTPKNSNKYKRPSEIDKLLMDEGALNMIYQLTPEAPKGKKNMKTKAEFIKKIQSSTPDSKEMKFRERKRDSKCEEGEPKKILGGKQRTSLSSSVKSPSVSEDFEAHSADDSIIYRRHSSSSYSSSCMSPRRLSDVEGSLINSRPLQTNVSDSQYLNSIELINDNSIANTFMGNSNAPALKGDIINKDDCLSIKQKLNSKLSLALNKRKRESGKLDKPLKQKKAMKSEDEVKMSEVVEENAKEYKHLSVTITDRLGEIFIRKSGSKYNLEVIRELHRALEFMNLREDISVTLLTSECGTLCSGLELSPLLDESKELKTKYAQKMAESVRSLLCLVERHSKLVCIGVENTCWGVGLALMALGDVTVASERAVFQMGCDRKGKHSGNSNMAFEPGVAVFTAHYRPWPQTLLNDLIVFGRQLSVVEALQYRLVSRSIWPERFLEQIRGIAKDIASQPFHNVLYKKKLLKINNDCQSTFLSCLEKERDLLINYWLSPEGQELLREQVKIS